MNIINSKKSKNGRTATSCGNPSGSPNDFAPAAFLASSASSNTTLNDQSESHSTYLGQKPSKYAYTKSIKEPQHNTHATIAQGRRRRESFWHHSIYSFMRVYGDDISAIQVATTIDYDYDYDIRTTLTGGGDVVCLRGDRGREGFGGSAFLFFRTEPLHDKLGGCGLGVSSCFVLFLFVWGGGFRGDLLFWCRTNPITTKRAAAHFFVRLLICSKNAKMEVMHSKISRFDNVQHSVTWSNVWSRKSPFTTKSDVERPTIIQTGAGEDIKRVSRQACHHRHLRQPSRSIAVIAAPWHRYRESVCTPSCPSWTRGPCAGTSSPARRTTNHGHPKKCF